MSTIKSIGQNNQGVAMSAGELQCEAKPRCQSKRKALAGLAYARELELRKIRKERRTRWGDNVVGIKDPTMIQSVALGSSMCHGVP
jgi:hypothetical protein